MKGQCSQKTASCLPWYLNTRTFTVSIVKGFKGVRNEWLMMGLFWFTESFDCNQSYCYLNLVLT